MALIATLSCIGADCRWIGSIHKGRVQQTESFSSIQYDGISVETQLNWHRVPAIVKFIYVWGVCIGKWITTNSDRRFMRRVLFWLQRLWNKGDSLAEVDVFIWGATYLLKYQSYMFNIVREEIICTLSFIICRVTVRWETAKTCFFRIKTRKWCQKELKIFCLGYKLNSIVHAQTRHSRYHFSKLYQPVFFSSFVGTFLYHKPISMLHCLISVSDPHPFFADPDPT